MRGGGAGTDGAAVEEDGSVNGGPGCMPIGRGRSEEEYDYGRYPVCVGRVVEYGPEGQGQAGHWWWYWRQQGAEV